MASVSTYQDFKLGDNVTFNHPELGAPVSGQIERINAGTVGACMMVRGDVGEGYLVAHSLLNRADVVGVIFKD